MPSLRHSGMSRKRKGHTAQRIEMRVSERYHHSHVHCSSKKPRKKWKQTKYPSVDDQVRKCEIYINAILFSPIKEDNLTICNNMDESGHYAK